MIFAKNFVRNYEKNNNWTIRLLVNEAIVPSIKRFIFKIVGIRTAESKSKSSGIIAKRYERKKCPLKKR